MRQQEMKAAEMHLSFVCLVPLSFLFAQVFHGKLFKLPLFCLSSPVSQLFVGIDVPESSATEVSTGVKVVRQSSPTSPSQQGSETSLSTK